MPTRNFDVIVKDRFIFLENEYGFKLTEDKLEEWGYDIQYKNEKTGVRIIYEYREAYIFIYIHKLINGKIEDIPRRINDDTVITGFSLDDVISIRQPEDLMKPAYAYGAHSEYYDKNRGLDLYISKFADNLRKHAADILIGDFKIFKELDKIVKTRSKVIL